MERGHLAQICQTCIAYIPIYVADSDIPSSSEAPPAALSSSPVPHSWMSQDSNTKLQTHSEADDVRDGGMASIIEGKADAGSRMCWYAHLQLYSTAEDKISASVEEAFRAYLRILPTRCLLCCTGIQLVSCPPPCSVFAIFSVRGRTARLHTQAQGRNNA